MDIRDRKEQLATDILKLTRLRLQMKLPVMSGALLLPEWKYRNDGKSTGTDGICLYWNPEEVLRWFHDAPIQVERRYLHLVLHCLYLHPLREPAAEKTIWNLACDLMTEYRIDQMAVQGFQRPVPAERSRCYRKLQEAHIAFREQAVTIWLEADCTMQERKELETVFSGDDHALWKSGGMENNPIVRYEQMPGRAEQLRKQVEVIHRWRTIFEELPVREQEHKRQAGGSAGQQVQTMVPGEDREYDYRRFLQRYAVWGEELEPDMDSFDYLPYYYSRSHYDRLLMLEPLEYKDVQKLQEFVIAIDTSGSCSGALVQRFLQETWTIFQEREKFFAHMNIHIIQCDCVIQEHVKITCRDEWQQYLETIQIKGHGDTDFTPVFRLVDQLMEDGEFRHLKGLLYFTDGDGIYPDVEPAYETAFVFINQKLKKGKTPDWAYDLNLGLETGSV